MKVKVLALAALGGLGSMTMPSISHAGNVGYYTACGDYIGIPASITAAGHTAAAINTLDAASLAPLDGLVIMCRYYSLNAAVDAAVANGMELFLEHQLVPANAGASLPGGPALVLNTYSTSGGTYCPTNTNLAQGSPIATGPGGILSNTSLGGNLNACSLMGYATSASLPSGSIPLLTTGNASEVVAFSYMHGNGRVIYSITQYVFGDIHWPGASTYLTNSIAWLLDGSSAPTTTCASEGHAGTQLQWCQNVCEKGYTGATLDMWLRRWSDRYRQLPYCAAPN